ncbi:HWE histidine kinase domain-containing protein [uncultured Algimonas sp.]|uniref:HWE histidine kinase domain-containing protein n=1 Tax=uncultured Algimonas sp. TaxID=1547920 RepID=UPI002604F100|nr:HWE histidine kinase domain-containing protein [uncultured Algimonas sp.]
MPDRTESELREEIVRLQDRLAAQGRHMEAAADAARQTARRLSLLEVVMETVPVGVVIADQAGQILHGNSQVEAMLGHPVLYSKDVDGYAEWVSFHEDGRQVESHEYPLSRVLRDGEDRSELDVHYQRGDGTRFWMRLIGQPVLDDRGERIGAAVALLDIDRERRLQDTQRILIGELDHRVKNAFSVVKSIVGQSLRKSGSPQPLRAAIDGRLDAYAAAHGKLVEGSWDRLTIRDIAADMLERIGDGHIRLSGPVVSLPSRQSLSLSMAFYELATNAVKYGALSVPGGTVTLDWRIARRERRGDTESGPDADETRLIFEWTEHGGPPPVVSEDTGFGSFLTGQAVALETGGEAHADYRPTGLVWTLDMPDPGPPAPDSDTPDTDTPYTDTTDTKTEDAT